MVPENREEGRNAGKDKSFRYRPYLPWAISIAGLTLSVLAYFSVKSWEDDVVRTSFEMLSAGHATSINVELARHLDVSDALVGLYAVSPHVEREQFDRYAVALMARHNDIQALIWTPRVAPAERSGVMEQTERDGLKDFRIRTVDGSDAPVTATLQADYFPILYVQPMKENNNLLGIDLMADPRYRVLLETARDTGLLAVSGPVQLDFKAGTSMGNGVLFARAVYRNGANPGSPAERREALEGFVLQLFRIDDLINEALKESAVLGVYISVVYGKTPDDQLRNNFRSTVSSGDQNIKLPPFGAARSAAALQLRVPLDYLGKSWALQFTPTPRFWANTQRWTSLVVLAAGLIVTAVSVMCSLRSAAKSNRS